MRILLFLVFATALAGCEDRRIKVYEIPRETPLPLETQMASDAQKPDWKVPAQWQELPPSGMRAASFSAKVDGRTLDISVVTFPGEAGGLLANVNRWRGQMKLAPAADAADLETLDADGQPLQIVELVNPAEHTGMLGAIFLRADQSWFVKLTGSDADIVQENARFRQFALSFRFVEKTPAATQSTNDG